ncbi:DUF4274 domain-containing protein [Cellulomonas phragmiteti]|uniref:DUF4274 domain-containing protein n=1 Tax=Cellulomonas phragmiteti TaxID=478780 RepID=A0ABQ4DIH2_9CELL|nr:DUF4274 domain-containing protein [Cellulomonas phragmiteti]GIG39158.1 hypothetical protein Cph01nite_09200 [Cellulomonas phragmiteti]
MSTPTPEPDAAEQFLRDFLQSATPQQRHTFVRRTSYDSGDATIRFVLDDPTTDRATALAAYWILGACYYSRYASADETTDDERPTWELLRTIEERYAAGFWADHGIAFDPTDDDEIDWTDDYGAPVARPVPDAMRRAVPGQPVDDGDTEDGLPLDVHLRWTALAG